MLFKAKTGIHLTDGLLTASRASWKKGRLVNISSCSFEFSDGSVVVTPLDANIKNEANFEEGLTCLAKKELLKAGTRVALSLPDHIARTVIIEVDSLPKSRPMAEDFLLWRLDKLFVTSIKGCRLSYHLLEHTGNSSAKKVVVSAINKDILLQYERILEKHGLIVVDIGISSFHVFNMFHDFMMTNSGKNRRFYFLYNQDESFCLIVVRDGNIEFVRCRHLRGHTEGGNGLSRVAKELEGSVRVYGGDVGIDKLFCFAEPALCEMLKEEMGIEILPLSPGLVCKNRADIKLSHMIAAASLASDQMVI